MNRNERHELRVEIQSDWSFDILFLTFLWRVKFGKKMAGVSKFKIKSIKSKYIGWIAIVFVSNDSLTKSSFDVSIISCFVLQILYTYPDNFRAYKALIAAQYSGAQVKIASDFVFGETNKSDAFLKKFPSGKVSCTIQFLLFILSAFILEVMVFCWRLTPCYFFSFPWTF